MEVGAQRGELRILTQGVNKKTSHGRKSSKASKVKEHRESLGWKGQKLS